MWFSKCAALLLALSGVTAAGAQQAANGPFFEAFETATVKPVDLNHLQSGRYFRLESTHRWIAVNFSLKNLLALAYDLNPRTISGGPPWMDSQLFNIEALTPGEIAPTRTEQMQMLRALLVERFSVRFHREPREFSIYELTVAKGGPKLKAAAHPEALPELTGVVYPDRIEVPARSVTMDDFVAMLQRATLDRPTLNKTGLSGKYDFTLDWAPDETQYSGEIPKAPDDATQPPLFTAVQEQLGLKLTPAHGMVSTMVVDQAQKPSTEQSGS